MKAGIFTATVQTVKNLGLQDTRHFRLALDPGAEFEFEAGQFINVLIPGKEKTLKRPYSIASPPGWKGMIELCWKKIPGGFATEYLWALKEGDRLHIQGPLGRFTVRKPLPKTLIFVSTGTGIAPFRSMIHDLLEKDKPPHVWNIYGNRFEEDILYRDEFEELAGKHANLRNVFTVSRPKSWPGETEYVQHILKKYIATHHHSHLYICGLSSMILDVEHTALNIGFTKEQIFYEKYD